LTWQTYKAIPYVCILPFSSVHSLWYTCDYDKWGRLLRLWA